MKCDKTRNRKGQWCLTETARYKMNKHLGGFKEEAELKFNELALDKYDFQTCQRADGSYYGTGGQCRKGTPATKPEKEGKKKSGGGVSAEQHSKNQQAAAKKEAKAIVEIAGGDAEGMIVKGGERVKPETLMRNVGKQLEKEYPGLKMNPLEANGEKIAAGYIDGFVSTVSGTSMSVSMERDGGEWIVESIDIL